MVIVGYEITYHFDRGDAWVNAVDPWIETGIAHKECAWNNDRLHEYHSGGDVADLRKITPEEARQQALVCDECKAPLTEKRWFAFQASLILLEVAS